jgi:hypothetical protein
MYPPSWGYFFHDVLLTVAFTFPENPTEEQKKHVTHLVTGMLHVLPCPGCGLHAVAYLKDHPLNVTSGSMLAQWLVVFHNHINKRLKKRDNWTVQEAKEALVTRHFADNKRLDRAQQMRLEDQAEIQKLQTQTTKTTTTTNNNNTYEIIIMVLVIIVIILLILAWIFINKRLQK